ncbi:unnamed protein product, partial [Ixodes pacificus]
QLLHRKLRPRCQLRHCRRRSFFFVSEQTPYDYGLLKVVPDKRERLDNNGLSRENVRCAGSFVF